MPLKQQQGLMIPCNCETCMQMQAAMGKLWECISNVQHHLSWHKRATMHYCIWSHSPTPTPYTPRVQQQQQHPLSWPQKAGHHTVGGAILWLESSKYILYFFWKNRGLDLPPTAERVFLVLVTKATLRATDVHNSWLIGPFLCHCTSCQVQYH